MSRSIKVKEETYDRLILKMEAQETFDKVVRRLLNVHDQISMVRDTLGPQHPVVSGLRREEP
uniref:Antitoxin n=1 Tax=viral metagenome TaxID=1070528 RepID=A0A6M3Y2E4_9ZZZZ